MNHDNPAKTRERFLQLAFEDNRIVVPARNSISTPMPLMPLPASQLNWMTGCAGRLWQRHRRCLALLLLVEPVTARWTLRFPRQRCGADGVHWSVHPDDFDGLQPGWLLGGTFQSIAASATRAGDRADLAGLVPAADGLHFIYVQDDGNGELRGYVRAGGELRTADQKDVLVNDWLAAVDVAATRVTLA